MMPQPQPIALIEQLFGRFLNAYGNAFVDKWSCADPNAVKQQWAQDLAGLTVEEIEYGFAKRPAIFPPTSKEFVLLCRPALDYEALFHIAVQQMTLRRQTGEDDWPSAMLFHAAVALGNDLLSQPYGALKRRWEAALHQAEQDIRSGKKSAQKPDRAVPESHQIAAPGKGITDRTTARKTLAEVKQWMKDHAKDKSRDA